MKQFFLQTNSVKPWKYHQIIVCIFFLNIISLQVKAQFKVGDPGVIFDNTKFDNRYPQMREWQKAGVRGGIPFLKNIKIVKTITSGANSDAINKSIVDASKQNGLVAVFLKNGTYNINKTITMKSNVVLIGESREGVKCIIKMRGGSAFRFYKVNNSGIYTLTIQGSWGKPKYNWNYSLNANDELPGNDNISVKFNNSTDCWLDKVNIYNSAKDPVRVPANHITLRDLKVDGAHKKAGGAQGYFFIQGAYNLITGCEITHLRHISLQGSKVEYNVVYDNDFKQEVSFHSGDNGNNLIENNRITLPKDMPNSKADTPNAAYNNRNEPNYYAIMGPWSTQHENSKNPNFIYKNNCVEKNHKNSKPWSNPNLLYKGPKQVKPRDPSTNFPALPAYKTPKGKTLYPIILEEDVQVNKLPVVNFKRLNDGDVFEQNTNLKPVIITSDNDGTISNVKLYLNDKFIRQESFAPYEWGHLVDKDEQLKSLKEGLYSLKAIVTDDKGGISEKIISITIKGHTPVGDCTPISEVNFPGGRVVLSFDGNVHDDDDIVAMPFAMALWWAAGLKDSVVQIEYNNHICGDSSNERDNFGSGIGDDSLNMKESAEQAKVRFGYGGNIMYDFKNRGNASTNKMAREIEKSTSSNPLWILAGGPVETIYRGLQKATKGHQNVTVISHGIFNQNHDHCKDEHNWFDLKNKFGSKGVFFVEHCKSNCENNNELNTQNGGFSSFGSAFDWLKGNTNPDLDWLYSRNPFKNKFDPSDAGMSYFLITGGPFNNGNKKGNARDARKLLENPCSNNKTINSVAKLNDKITLRYTPNPFINYLTISGFYDSDKRNIQIYDLKGNLIKSIITRKNEITVDLTSLISGVYFVKIFSYNNFKNNIKTSKIIKL
ncbi:T9SS type A sorting domain-containing protein [Aquimarina aggregata]|uniref:T9SS type A sorting domain-containing protein n=1 Tax=Aquimarina aggregata TaxID=1642818 RepID=UPI0024922377|nr:T9SS type A sorting domain-containing protein [Aquimarina aggregata]